MAKMLKSQANQLALTKQGSYSDRAQWITHQLYDTLAFPATVLPMSFFTVPQGASKSVAMTNMKQAGQLPSNQDYRFWKVEISLFNGGTLGAQQDANTMAFITAMQNSNHRFRIDGREFDLEFSGATLLPAIAGVGTTAGNIGRMTAKGEFRIAQKINIGALTSFEHIVTFDSSASTALGVLTTACKLQVRLVGELVRRM